MSNQTEGDPLPGLTAYDKAKYIWMYMLTDDDACRDICDREAHFTEVMTSTYPELPTREIRLLGKMAFDSMMDQFHLY